MSEQRECPNCGNTTYGIEYRDGLSFLVCKECSNASPCEIWEPTETPPADYQDLKNEEAWEEGKMEAFEPLAEVAQEQANHFFSEEDYDWDEARDIAINNVLDEAVRGRDLPRDYDLKMAAEDIERLMSPADAVVNAVLDRDRFDVEMAESFHEHEGRFIVDLDGVTMDEFELMYWLEDQGIQVNVRHNSYYEDEEADVYGTPVRFGIPGNWS